MQTVCWMILVTGAYPLWRACLANRATSLLHALLWAVLAWLAWVCWLGLGDRVGQQPIRVGSYLALCLTGCAAIAVLGARRPGVTAWNFVVVGLLAVNLLPLAESAVMGGVLHLDLLRILCVAGTIAVGVLNYLPTRLAPAAIVLAVACGLHLAILSETATDHPVDKIFHLGSFLMAFVPWLGYVAVGGDKSAAAPFDRLWLGYRNRFGFVWSQRLREQFNRSASNNGWPVVLRWQGLRLSHGAELPDPAIQSAMLGALRALMKRFVYGLDESSK